MVRQVQTLEAPCKEVLKGFAWFRHSSPAMALSPISFERPSRKELQGLRAALDRWEPLGELSEEY